MGVSDPLSGGKKEGAEEGCHGREKTEGGKGRLLCWETTEISSEKVRTDHKYKEKKKGGCVTKNGFLTLEKPRGKREDDDCVELT